MKKINRTIILDKYDSHCAYCGKEITLKTMQIDHLVPLHRTMPDAAIKKWNVVRGTNDFENLMPSCASCNHYKSSFTLEGFREQLMFLRQRLNDTSVIYNISKRYGLIEEKENRIKFYFEK